MVKENFQTTIFNYMRWIAENYQRALKVNLSQPPLKIVSSETDVHSSELIFRVQIVGKNLFPTFKASDIILDKSIFYNFSPEDQKIILQSLPNKHHIVTKRITARTYQRKEKKFFFTIESSFESKRLKKCLPAFELLQSDNGLHGFSADDAFLIGLEVGKEVTF